ncbi:MAG: hypothetical protein ACP5IA_09985, partial [Sediminispirochaetaceae bacterium]
FYTAGGKEIVNSQNPRYRAAFLLTQVPERYYVDDSVLGIEPVMVYQRKDGHDGRIEKFNCRTACIIGDSETEELLRVWKSGGAIPIRAIRLCSYLYTRLWQQGKGRLELPVELYLERAGRLKREKRAEPRCIKKINIRWMPADECSHEIRYCAHISLSDEQEYSETYVRENSPVEQNGELLLIPNVKTGVLWYISHFDLSNMYFGKIEDIAALFDPDSLMNTAEIASLARQGRSQWSDLVDIGKAPAHVEILQVPPVPVIEIDPDRSSSPEYPFTMVTLRFSYRHGNKNYTGRCEDRIDEDCIGEDWRDSDLYRSERIRLIPVAVEEDSARCIACNHAAEADCIRRFFSVHKKKVQPYKFFPYEDFPNRLMIEASAAGL